jgi:hypothetical protein
MHHPGADGQPVPGVDHRDRDRRSASSFPDKFRRASSYPASGACGSAMCVRDPAHASPAALGRTLRRYLDGPLDG